MVYRIFVEKKKELANEARALLSDARVLLGIDGLTEVRVLNRYDAENISSEIFEYAVETVFSEPQVDIATGAPEFGGAAVFAVEFLPGQFDQRADSAAQCIQLISRGERPLVRSAKVYALYGDISESDVEAIKKYVINPVEAREASLERPETLKVVYAIPTQVATVEGFTKLDSDGLERFIRENGLAMDPADAAFCREYFLNERRDPTITEIKLIDTYWSDHCRHTTFNTIIDDIKFNDPQLEAAYRDYLAMRKELGRSKPICLMDIGTIATKWLKAEGKLQKLDESEEINACTVRIDVSVNGVKEPWLLLFKNETHNHPTEIEPFGGAATCIGGAIRDPLSGRSYVYGAMRLSGAADPLTPVSETIPGKLPQRKIVTTAAAGYSSYGNQIGLATGMVDELYHPGYAAKHMEVGAVIAAAPAANVRREVPSPGDVVLLIGGSTGRDGIGGATGSSKSHDAHSVESCGAEVQKGNAPEERKLQRLFRNPEASRMIKRCNDFGAGGVSVAIGELAAGLTVELDAVPKKYEGLDGTELAISESQERMAVVVEARDEAAFLALAEKENLQACRVAVVKEEPRLTMRWNGHTIVDISREFLDSNGAEKHISIETSAPSEYAPEPETDFARAYEKLAADLNICSKRGLSERFDSTIGAGTVLMPFGGKNQLTPIQAMVHKISVENGDTDDVSFMSWGCDPQLSSESQYKGAYLAVVDSVCKLIASGASFEDVYLSFQEYFGKPGRDPKRWGKPLGALLGAFEAQKDLGIAAIGGKDSMSGSFGDMDVPPTLISFAVTTGKLSEVISPEFKRAGDSVVLLAPEMSGGLPEPGSMRALFKRMEALMRSGKLVSCWAAGRGGAAEAVMKMAFGNGFGFKFEDGLSVAELFETGYGAFVAELCEGAELPDGALYLGTVTDDAAFTLRSHRVGSAELLSLYEDRLESVYACNIPDAEGSFPTESFDFKGARRAPAVKTARPRVVIPVFPGTNCEYDSARAVRAAGADAEILVIRNRSSDSIKESIDALAESISGSQMIFLPGGFSAADEPDGSGKFITAVFRNEAVKEQVTALLERRDGLICGICNGFQALIKLGLVPYGRIIEPDAGSPTLSFNAIARHQSRIVRVRVASNMSPWLSLTNVGDIYSVPVSHGEGRFLADGESVRRLAASGQIATQYVGFDGEASADVRFNVNGSVCAIEGITSPDGRVFGKMGHSERIGKGLYMNVPGSYDIRMFEAAVRYFR